jgi:surface antigen
MKADRYSGVYGHVAVVIDIDQDNGLILVEEQNYA